MLKPFPEQLKALIDGRFQSARAFIRAAEPKAIEGSASKYLSYVLAGERPPPLDRIEAWADALGLIGDDRQTFIDLAALEHLPAPVRARHIGIYHAFKTQEASIVAQEERIASLEAKFKGRGK